MPLLFVPTPLGNLRDITLRAIDALRECALLVAEDTRVARKLLSALKISGKETWSYHEHNAASAADGIVERARTELVAVVTDAGMPGISDPGTGLVRAARKAGVAVEVLPGPSAATSVAVLCGFPIGRFIFEGFPPRTQSARRDAFARSFDIGVTSIWYESPQRIHAFLRDVDAVDPTAEVFVLREYTKRFEEHLSGHAADVASRLSQPVLGEIAVAISPSQRAQAPPDAGDVDAHIDALLEQNCSVPAIAKALSESGAGERRDLYARAAARKSARREPPAGKDR